MTSSRISEQETLYKVDSGAYKVNGVTTKEGVHLFLICRDNRKVSKKDYGWKIYEGMTIETAEPVSFPHDRKSKCFDEVSSKLRKGQYVLNPSAGIFGEDLKNLKARIRDQIRSSRPIKGDSPPVVSPVESPTGERKTPLAPVSEIVVPDQTIEPETVSAIEQVALPSFHDEATAG